MRGNGCASRDWRWITGARRGQSGGRGIAATIPEHLSAVSALVEDALRLDGLASTRQTVVLGAGACTEIPLERLARASAHVSLVDLDVAGMAQARDELPATVRDRVDLLQADLTGGVSEALAAELRATPFADLNLLDQGRGMAPVEAAADCLERCPVPRSANACGSSARRL